MDELEFDVKKEEILSRLDYCLSKVSSEIKDILLDIEKLVKEY